MTTGNRLRLIGVALIVFSIYIGLEIEDELVVIRMGGIAPDRVLSILNRLAQDLRVGDVDAGGLVYEEIKQRVVTLVTSYPDGARAFVSWVLGL